MAPESKPPIARIAATSSCPPIEIYAAKGQRRVVSPPSPKFKHGILETIELSRDKFIPCALPTAQRMMWLGKILIALCPEKERIPLSIRKKEILLGGKKIGSVLKPGTSVEKLKVWADLFFGPQDSCKRGEKIPLPSILPFTVIPLHFQVDYRKLMVCMGIARFASITYSAKEEKAFLEFYASKRGSPIVSFIQR